MTTPSAASETRVDVKALTPAALESLLQDAGYPAYRGRQLFDWLHRRRASTFDEMDTLPRVLRSWLADTAEIRSIEPTHQLRSADGTVKTLFRLASGRSVETVLIPDFNADRSAKRLTVCVSSQVGCAMGCTFCATGRMGFHQDLAAYEIADQVTAMNSLAIDEFRAPVTNVVFMGMGEPLLNFQAVLDSVSLISDARVLGLSQKRITISTVGLATRIRDLADANPGVKLAISLHAPDDEKRSSIMPINRKAKTDLRALRESVVYYYEHTRSPITYEYCMFAGFNDSEQDAARLAAVTRWAPSKVNLIMYNQVDGTGFQRTDEENLNAFIAHLVEQSVRVTVRRSRGQDIAAACGQLAVDAA